jgi:BNR repeat-like domain
MKRLIFAVLVSALSFFIQTALAGWTPAKRLTWSPGYSEDPSVAVDSADVIHLVWDDDKTGNAEIYYRRSPDGGTTWSPAKRLTWSSGFSTDAAIGIDADDTIHIAWNSYTPFNYEIEYCHSTDGGMTWSPAQRLTWNSGKSVFPALGIDSTGTVHIVWEDDTPGNYEIYHKKSTDKGKSWSAAQRLTWNSGGSFVPALATDADDRIHVVWHDYTPGKAAVFYKRSLDGGTTWSPVKSLSSTLGNSCSPDISLDANKAIHVVWNDDAPGNFEIRYGRSTDSGLTWNAAQRLTWNSGSSASPTIVAGSGQVLHIVWHDETPGNAEIFYKKSTDGGEAWSVAQRLTWSSAYSYVPSMAADSTGTLHLVWQETDIGAPGNAEIYYKNGK